MLKTPELNRMKAVQSQSQAIGAFIEWLGNNKLTICQHDDGNWHYTETGEKDYRNLEGYYPDRRNIERILADYFEIDLDKVEKEKSALLDDFRQRTSAG